jgi:hypothetical protein
VIKTLIPRRAHEQARCCDLLQAISEHMAYGARFPSDWLKELTDLLPQFTEEEKADG